MISDDLFTVAQELAARSNAAAGRAWLVEIRDKALGYFSRGQVSTPVSWSYSGQAGTSQVNVSPDVMLQHVMRAIRQFDDEIADTGAGEAPTITFPTFNVSM